MTRCGLVAAAPGLYINGMAPPLLILRDICLTFGGTPLLDGAELMVGESERLCLVGRNGSGKSTLLKIAAGDIQADNGERFVQPGATLRYLAQEPSLSGHASVLAYVQAGLGPGDDQHRARHLLERLGLTGSEDPARLSGGEARRAALARVMAPDPDILLLDEPTNHLDLPAIEWLEAELGSRRSALVIISHDRRFLETLSRATVWLDRGTTRRIDSGFGSFEAWRDEALEQEERDRHKLDRKLAMEADWLRYGVTARRKRNQGRLKALHALRRERREQRLAQGTVRMAVSEARTSGKLVIEAADLNKSYGGRVVVRDFSLRVGRGDRVGIVGPNGAGKTTLLKLLTGATTPDSGAVRFGANLDVVTLDQQRESLDGGETLARALTGGAGDTVRVGSEAKHVVSYMKDFLFAPEQARTPVSHLSGGERGRLMLARALARASNLMVLDEPTNDLDLETLDMLQEMIAEYAGTVLVVSHDRDFLDRVATSIVASEGNGQWIEYAGGYSDMVAQRGPVREAPVVAARTARPGPARRGDGVRRATKGMQKLSFKQKHALETLPRRIDALQAEAAALQTVLADPGFYARDPAAFAATATSLEKVRAELGAAEEEWLTLEMLREEFEGA